MTEQLNRTIARSRALSCLIILLTIPAAIADDDVKTQESRWFKNVRQVTFKEMGLIRTGEAYFSPDGKRICFQAYPPGKTEYQIYVMNLDGTGLKMVSTGEGATTCSFFHPDGKRMLFASNHLDQREPEKPSELHKRHGGGEESGGHPGGGHPGGGHPGAKPGGESGEKHPGEHPGAKSDTGHSRSGYAWKYHPGMDIFEYTFATGELKQLTTADGYDAEGSYSPDGKHIVFSSFRDGDQEIYIADSDGGNPRRITHAKGKDGGPFFSPDGKRICYRSDRVGNELLQIYTNNFEGTDERAITENDVMNWCPFWHPSGKWMIFTQGEFGAGPPQFDLYLLRDDGSERTRVTWDSAFDGLPVFSPDGKYLMWTSTREDVDAPQLFIADFVGLTPDGDLR